MIIGLTGTYGSGKDTVAEYLEKNRNFIHYSLSDELRAELVKRGIPPVRENLIRIGSELRGAEGFEVLAKRVSRNFLKEGNYVITSVRHPAEIAELKKNGDFFMVNVDAPAVTRFERLRKRARPGDPQTIEKLFEMEKAESQTSGSGQQLGECRKLADFTLLNDTESLSELHSRIEKMLIYFDSAKGRNKMPESVIMIVDDDEDANYTLRAILENAGFKVASFFDGASALEKIKEINPGLVVLDVMMPGISGYDVCEKIKSDPETSGIPVIMLTAKDMGEDIEMALKKKADWFVTKPYDNKYLVGKITQFVTKKP